MNALFPSSRRRRSVLAFLCLSSLPAWPVQATPEAGAQPSPSGQAAKSETSKKETPKSDVLPPAQAQALAEIDAELARFRQRTEETASEVTKAAMRTRYTVLAQRREELGKRFTPERYAALKADLQKEVKVEHTLPPATDSGDGRAHRKATVLELMATREAAERAAAAERKAELERADRAAEAASRQRMELARLDSDLAQLSAQIDASTVGDPNRRAELAMRLNELQQRRRQLEQSYQPFQHDLLKSDIQRETEQIRPWMNR